MSGTAPFRLVFPAMTLTHALIGIGEAMITVAVVSFVAKVRPDLLYEARRQEGVLVPSRGIWIYGLLIALGTALLLSPLASSLPDGLERLAEQLSFPRTTGSVLAAPLPEYSMPGIQFHWLATSVSASIGTLLTFGIAWGLASAISRRLRRGRTESQAKACGVRP